MSQRPDPPPEGTLLKAALTKSGLSARSAAAAAGISEGRWRQIVSGYQTISAGVYAPVRGPKETVARMANVVGLSPALLEEAGRSDAADVLRDIQAAKDARAVPPDLAGIEDPSPAEAAMLQYLASLQEEIRQLNKKVDAITMDRDQDSGNDGRQQRGA
ncbi:hypothetical protein [Streptomyces sp.]|jgi:plasmid maintenance system antidote protein VapI|uniref:hypothetical protein n=1 Tax=Streptomyces sp. TaxID=1931 RepID=UPI002F934815